MTKRIGIIAVLALAMAAAAAAQDRVDLVVLLDSSQSMFPYYNQVVDYVLSETVREYMRFGDAFHLIGFSDSTQVEIAQVLRTEQDLKSVIARLYLLYPLGRNTDLVTAIKNAYQYVADLPEGSAKHIILITDGMHSPAPATQYAELDAAGVRSEIDRSAARIRERGWTMRIVRVPFNGAAGLAAAGSSGSSPDGPPIAGTAGDAAGGRTGEAAPSAPGSGDYLSDVAAAVGAEVLTFDPENASSTVENSIDLPRVSFPADLGAKDYAFTLPMDVENRSSRPLSLELTGLLLQDGSDILRAKEIAEIQPGKSTRLNLRVMLPEALPEGKASLSLEPRFADGLRVSPARTAVSVSVRRSPLSAFFRNSARVALFFVILGIACVAAFVIAAYIRRIHRKAEEPIVDALLDSAAPRHDRDAARSLQEAAARGQHVSPFAASGASAVADRSPAATATPYAPDAGRDRAAILAAAAGGARHVTAGETGTTVVSSGTGDASRDRASILASASKSQRRSIAPEAAAAVGQIGSEPSGSAALLASWKAPDASRRRLPMVSEIEAARTIGASSARAPVHYEGRVERAGSARLVLRVAGQNPNIGKRNIRPMHSGGRASVGGGSSDFLVFLLPVPRAVAWLYYDGVDATLVPSRPEFFPDYDGAVSDCIGKDIRMVTARGKELIIRFDRYAAPIDRINKILHCIEAPGLIAPATSD